MIHIRLHVAGEIAAHLEELAALRLAVFRGWPYFYCGDAARERRYLATYARSPGSLFVLALDDDRIVGASMSIPLQDESARYRRPFLERGLPVGPICHFGESVLLPDYRGVGLGHRFFDERERHARRCGRYSMTTFCAFERDAGDPRRPADYRPNDAFWSRRGYRRQEDMACELDWPEHRDAIAVRHRLQFWLRPLDTA